jgi:uncharacterized protein Yka (UPF0111/DUF47 family)
LWPLADRLWVEYNEPSFSLVSSLREAGMTLDSDDPKKVREAIKKQLAALNKTTAPTKEAIKATDDLEKDCDKLDKELKDEE